MAENPKKASQAQAARRGWPIDQRAQDMTKSAKLPDSTKKLGSYWNPNRTSK